MSNANKNLSNFLYNKAIYLPSLLFFSVLLLFSLFYLFSEYEQLSQWFRALNPCFYKNESWQQDFFTKAIKQQGNKYCIVAVIGSIAGLCYCFFKITVQSTQSIPKQLTNRGAFIYPILLTIVGIALWLFSHKATSPAYDEIFSATDCAGIHPFQTLSYYMLPNNHILFNVTNAVLFYAAEDKVFSGRIISLFIFLVALQFGFALLRQKMTPFFAFFTIIFLSLSLPTLGFASQARGYTFQLLAGWIALFSFYQYIKTGQSRWGRWQAVALFIGYASIPSFLFFHAALLAFAFIVQLEGRKFDVIFWKYQFLALAFSLAFYLPALCFSGLGALSGNRYVATSTEVSLWSFLAEFSSMLFFYLNNGVSCIFPKDSYFLYFLYLLPIALFFSKNKENRAIALFYVLMWLTVAFIVIFIKKFPFTRNLIVHYSVGLAIIAYTIYIASGYVAQKLKMTAVMPILYTVFLAIFAFFFLINFRSLAANNLYFNNANELFSMHKSDINKYLPKDGTSLAFSSEAFYWKYICQQEKYKVSDCPKGDETYYIKRISEAMPERLKQNYDSLIKLEAEDYEIMRRRY